MWPETFSQYDEEQAILAYFQGIKHRLPAEARFIDIGAWDPKCFSNTRALFELGWRGVLIEPSPTAMLSLLREYGNKDGIELVLAAASIESSPLKMWMTADAVSTSDPASHKKNKEQGGYFGVATVMTITWEQINNWFGGFQFANIDAEGISVDLFHAMVKSGARPDCCCVEHDGRLVELAAAASANGVSYKMIYSNGTNAVFAR